MTTNIRKIKIIYAKSENLKDKAIRIITLPLPEPMKMGYGEKSETILRNTILRLAGDEKKAMIDLYRYLVLSNYSRLNGKGGHTAKAELEHLYPPQSYLPDFRNYSNLFNTSGVIALLLLTHADKSIESWFHFLGSVLTAMLQKESIWDKPQFDANLIELV
jgi:hypothetical protein